MTRQYPHQHTTQQLRHDDNDNHNDNNNANDDNTVVEESGANFQNGGEGRQLSREDTNAEDEGMHTIHSRNDADDAITNTINATNDTSPTPYQNNNNTTINHITSASGALKEGEEDDTSANAINNNNTSSSSPTNHHPAVNSDSPTVIVLDSLAGREHHHYDITASSSASSGKRRSTKIPNAVTAASTRKSLDRAASRMKDSSSYSQGNVDASLHGDLGTTPSAASSYKRRRSAHDAPSSATSSPNTASVSTPQSRAIINNSNKSSIRTSKSTSALASSHQVTSHAPQHSTVATEQRHHPYARTQPHHHPRKSAFLKKHPLKALTVNFSADNLVGLGSSSHHHRSGRDSTVSMSPYRKSYRKSVSMRMEHHTPITREKKDLHTINSVRDLFTKKVEMIALQFGVNLNYGLKEEDVRIRKEVFGENKLKREKSVSIIKLFLSHLIGVVNFVLVVAAIGSIVAAALESTFDWIEGVLILFIIVANTVIGFSQDYRSAKTMQTLMKLFAPEAVVTRNGTVVTVKAEDLVPGDIVHLEDGDFVPADLRLTEAVNLHIDEAFLTGEADPVAKTFFPLKPEEAKALGDRTNMAYMSSVVTGGRGKGIVVRTGEDTEIGEVAKKLRNAPKDKSKTQLQKSIKTLGLTLFLAAIAFTFLVLAIQLLAVGPDAFTHRETWLYIVALCEAMIPEGLPAIMALTLVIGMRSMAKKNAIVRKIGVMESLNWVTDICADKTGTLTKGKMVATLIWCEEKYRKVSGTGIIPEGQILERNNIPVNLASLTEDRTLTQFFQACALCNMATISKLDDEWQATSSPTEIALQVLAHKADMGKPKLEEDHQFLGEHPFDTYWKRMSVIYKRSTLPIDPNFDNIEVVESEDTVLFMKGSVESVLSCCSHYRGEGDVTEMTPELRKQIHKETEAMASQGLRVLACAMKDNFHFSTNQNRQKTDEQSTFLGLVGIQDPPRVQSKPAVEKAHQAGINVYMLTGDHARTAFTVAKQVGIIQTLHDTLMLGSQFEQQVGGELPKVVARATPNTKTKMIEELHARGKFVLTSGDGVNDAPAIKKSDVGVAMGINGSEVTKDSADIVLMDDNFGTIIEAIEEARRIFANIQKIILFLMTNNVSEIMILVIGLCFSFFIPNTVVYPLTPMQILWINVITDTPVCMALGAESVARDAMSHPPHPPNEGLFSMEMNIDILVYGLCAGSLSLANFAISLFTSYDPNMVEIIDGHKVHTSIYIARAVCFFTLNYCMLFHGFNCLGRRSSIMLHKFDKKWILITVFTGAVVVLFTVYCPWINTHIFKHYYLGWVEWIQVVAAVCAFAIFSELYKLLKHVVISSYRNGKYMIHLAERVSNSLSNIDAKIGASTNEVPQMQATDLHMHPLV